MVKMKQHIKNNRSLHYNVITDPPDYIDTQLVCDPSTIPTPPAQSKLILSSQSIPMCESITTKYICNAGGINAFMVLFITRIFDFLDLNNFKI